MSLQECPGCMATLPNPEAPFCGVCREQVNPLPAEAQPEAIVDGMWRPRPSEFARRIAPADLPSWFSKHVNIDASQAGLLFEDGVFKGTLEPGREKLQSFPERVMKLISGKAVAAVLVRRGSFPLVLSGTYADSSGSDISYSCEIGVRVDHSDQFYVELMGTNDVLISGQLLRRLGPQIRKAIWTIAGQKDATELMNPHPELVQRLTDELGDRLEADAERLGLILSYISPVAFALGPDAAEFQKKRASYIQQLRDEKLDLELERKRQEIETQRYVLSRAAKDATARAGQEDLERDEQQAKLRRQVEYRLNVDELNLKEQFEAKVDEIFQLQRSRDEARDDHDSERTHGLALISVRRQLELCDLTFERETRSLEQNGQLDDIRRDQQIKAAAAQHQAELESLERTEAAQIVRWTLRQDAEREQGIRNAETSAAVRDVERDTREKDAEAEARAYARDIEEASQALDLKQKAQAVKHQKHKNVQALAEEAADNAHRRSEESKQADLERTLQMGSAPALTQLLAPLNANPGDATMASTVAPLIQMEMAKGLTLEQILAVNGTNPEAAETMRELFRTQAATSPPAADESSAQQLAVVDRLLAQLDSSRNASQQQLQQMINELKEIHLHDAKMFRDIAMANAGAAPSDGAANDGSTQEDPTSKEMMELLKELRAKLTEPDRNDD